MSAEEWSIVAARYAKERDDWKARADALYDLSKKQEARADKLKAALRMAVAIVEKEHLPPEPNHSCRPDDQCDQSCADYFYACQDLQELRAALAEK